MPELDILASPLGFIIIGKVHSTLNMMKTIDKDRLGICPKDPVPSGMLKSLAQCWSLGAYDGTIGHLHNPTSVFWAVKLWELLDRRAVCGVDKAWRMRRIGIVVNSKPDFLIKLAFHVESSNGHPPVGTDWYCQLLKCNDLIYKIRTTTLQNFGSTTNNLKGRVSLDCLRYKYDSCTHVQKYAKPRHSISQMLSERVKFNFYRKNEIHAFLARHIMFVHIFHKFCVRNRASFAQCCCSNLPHLQIIYS